ncbi:MAG TPA: hypothetical protein PKD74_04840 [Candidatus Dependentiae bacterium]|nr:hypothetical protein [Candidatus Dependentiae bacterium]
MKYSSIVMSLSVLMALLSSHGMAQQAKVSAPVHERIVSAVHQALPIHAPVRQSKLSKWGSLLAFSALEEYVGLHTPVPVCTEESSSLMSFVKSVWKVLGNAGEKFFRLLNFRNKSSYILVSNGKVLRRCYASQQPRVFTDLLDMMHKRSDLTNPPGLHVDKRVFARKLLVELGALGLTAVVNSYLLKNVKTPNIRVSPFVRGVASRVAQSLLYSGVKKAVVKPVVNFADRVQQKGFRAACDAHWYQPLYQC